MNKHIFNPTPINFHEEPLFLGTNGRNVARLELEIEQQISKDTAAAVGRYWIPTEFPYANDGKDFSKMNKSLQNLYMKNLKFQTLLDSVASRSVSEVFLPITTNPQLEAWWYQHAFFESNIHSQTYAEILKAQPVDTMTVFDDIVVNKDIVNRGKAIVDCFEDTVRENAKWLLQVDYNIHAHKKSIVKSLHALLILEAMLFKTSFLTSFAFKENNLMGATADAIAKISMDETGHFAMVANLIRRLRKDPEWAYIFEENKEEFVSMFKEASEADYKWVDYLYEDEPQLLGISRNALKQYVRFNTNATLRTVGYETIYDKTTNPCSWADKYDKPGNFQVAQKEKVSGNYSIGSIDRAMTADDWSRIES